MSVSDRKMDIAYLVQVSAGERAGEEGVWRTAAAAESTAVQVLVIIAAGPHDSRPVCGGGGGGLNHARADRLDRGAGGGGG